MPAQHFDVVIIGAGLSGIGAAYRLQTRCPGKSYAIFEARDAIGGTWDLFRYPRHPLRLRHVHPRLSLPPVERSQSHRRRPVHPQLHPRNRPRVRHRPHIHFNHRVVSAAWSSDESRWTHHRAVRRRARSVHLPFSLRCTGYYGYEAATRPTFPGANIPRPARPSAALARRPRLLRQACRRHRQRRTAVTLVPAMAETAAHVTMLQRSPSYVLALPARDPIADVLRRVSRARRPRHGPLEEHPHRSRFLPNSRVARPTSQNAS